MREQLKTFVCHIKEDFYKLIGDGVFFSVYIVAAYEKWILLHGFAMMFTLRFAVMIYDIYKRRKDMKRPEWESHVKPILKADAIRERRKPIGKKLWEIIKLMFFR